MGGMIVLQLAAVHPDCVAAIVMVDQPLVYSPERRAALEAMAAAIEAGNQEPLSQWIKNMFLPTSDRRLTEKVLAVMLSAPPHVAASAVRGALEFDARAAAALCTVPALHLAASPPRACRRRRSGTGCRISSMVAPSAPGISTSLKFPTR